MCKRAPFCCEASLSPVIYVEICTNLEKFKMARIVSIIGFEQSPPTQSARLPALVAATAVEAKDVNQRRRSVDEREAEGAKPRRLLAHPTTD